MARTAAAAALGTAAAGATLHLGLQLLIPNDKSLELENTFN